MGKDGGGTGHESGSRNDAGESGVYNLHVRIDGEAEGRFVTHANVVRLFTETEPWFHFGPGDVWTMFHSYAFDFSVWELWGALVYGGCVVIVPYWVSRSPQAFCDLLHRERVTVLNQTPSAFTQLIAAEAGGGPCVHWRCGW